MSLLLLILPLLVVVATVGNTAIIGRSNCCRQHHHCCDATVVGRSSYCGGGVDPILCVSTHRISDPRSGPPSFSPHTASSAATPTGFVHKSQTVSVVGMSGQLKRCNESWFGSLQSGQFAAGWLAGSILCRK